MDQMLGFIFSVLHFYQSIVRAEVRLTMKSTMARKDLWWSVGGWTSPPLFYGTSLFTITIDKTDTVNLHNIHWTDTLLTYRTYIGQKSNLIMANDCPKKSKNSSWIAINNGLLMYAY